MSALDAFGNEYVAEGGHAYPPGDRRRYTAKGWDMWLEIAIREGRPIPLEDARRILNLNQETRHD